MSLFHYTAPLFCYRWQHDTSSTIFKSFSFLLYKFKCSKQQLNFHVCDEQKMPHKSTIKNCRERNCNTVVTAISPKLLAIWSKTTSVSEKAACFKWRKHRDNRKTNYRRKRTRLALETNTININKRHTTARAASTNDNNAEPVKCCQCFGYRNCHFRLHNVNKKRHSCDGSVRIGITRIIALGAPPFSAPLRANLRLWRWQLFSARIFNNLASCGNLRQHLQTPLTELILTISQKNNNSNSAE